MKFTRNQIIGASAAGALVLVIIIVIVVVVVKNKNKNKNNNNNNDKNNNNNSNCKNKILDIKMDFSTFLINDKSEYKYTENNINNIDMSNVMNALVKKVKISDILENDNDSNCELKLTINVHKDNNHPIKVTDKDNKELTDLSNITKDVMPLTFQCKKHANMKFILTQ
jgi:hypothetical protein